MSTIICPYSPTYTTLTDEIRVRIPIGIAYDADLKKAKEIITKVSSELDWVMRDPAPKIVVRSFGESAVDLQEGCGSVIQGAEWTPSPTSRTGLKRSSIKKESKSPSPNGTSTSKRKNRSQGWRLSYKPSKACVHRME